MQDFLIELIAGYPYASVGLIFVLCGIGLPLPEEVILVIAGYTCFNGYADVLPMMASCALGMALGDMIPYVLGRIFGVRLLRLRPLRVLFTKDRLARFDRWFRKRGDLVIFFARFLAGIRTVAFFTAGTMRMPLHRFALLDGAGIALLVPVFVYGGFRFGGYIDDAIRFIQRLERGVLIGTLAAAAVFVVWWWLRRRRLARAAAAGSEMRDSYVEPKKPVVRGVRTAGGSGESTVLRPTPLLHRVGIEETAPEEPDAVDGGQPPPSSEDTGTDPEQRRADGDGGR